MEQKVTCYMYTEVKNFWVLEWCFNLMTSRYHKLLSNKVPTSSHIVQPPCDRWDVKNHARVTPNIVRGDVAERGNGPLKTNQGRCGRWYERISRLLSGPIWGSVTLVRIEIGRLISITRQRSPLLENAQCGNPSRMVLIRRQSLVSMRKVKKRPKLLAYRELRMVVRSEITRLSHDGAVCLRHLGRCREG